MTYFFDDDVFFFNYDRIIQRYTPPGLNRPRVSRRQDSPRHTLIISRIRFDANWTRFGAGASARNMSLKLAPPPFVASFREKYVLIDRCVLTQVFKGILVHQLSSHWSEKTFPADFLAFIFTSTCYDSE